MLRFSAVCLTLVAPLAAQILEPDLVMSDLGQVTLFGQTNGFWAYSVGTTSCNAGTASFNWNPTTSVHAIVTQNMYRLVNGRLEQIGMSWVRHSGNAATVGSCGTCPGPSAGNTLSAGCSVSATAAVNGAQASLTPRSEVNASSGVFVFPTAGNYPAPGPIYDRRLKVASADLDPALNVGAKYFVEAQCIHPEDAALFSGHNNASYRPISIHPVTHQPAFTGPTQQTKAGIHAWQDADPSVQIATVDVPGDGRFLVGFKATPIQENVKGPIGYTSKYHYEYAVQNLSSDRSIGAVAIDVWGGASLSNIGFRAPAHHSGEPYATAPWPWSVTPGGLFPGSISWATTPHATDPNANALRFGSLFNFWFDCNQLPGDLHLTLFKPGTPTSITIPAFVQTKRSYEAFFSWNSSSLAVDVIDIATAGLPGPVGNDAAMVVPIGFTFPFYEQQHNQVVISTNGYLTFPGQSGLVAQNVALPDPAAPNGMIAVYWDDLDCSNIFDIRYATVPNPWAGTPYGAALGDWFVVRWNCRHAGDSQPLEFEAILKPNGAIVTSIIQCPSNFLGSGATLGLQGPAGTYGQMHSCNSYGTAVPGTSVRWTRNWATSDLLASGSLAGGYFRLTYAGSPNAPILLMTMSSMYAATDFGPIGVFPINPLTSLPIADYHGLLSGAADPSAITDASGRYQLLVWIPPGILPPGFVYKFFGIDFPVNPIVPEVPNGWFNISNPVVSATY